MTDTARETQAKKTATVRENKSNGHAKVFDLDAYQAEAVREPFPFTLHGEDFALAHLADLDWHIALGEDGSFALPTVNQNLRAALGEDWDRFAAQPLSNGGYNELARRWYKHSGIDLGEVTASPDSSESTAGQ